MKDSKIEWTDHTFNPWEGCTEVSPGCVNCYAAARNRRFGGGIAHNWGKGAPRRRTSADNWKLPLKWNLEADSFRECLQCGRRASMADVCHQCGKTWPSETIAARPRVFCASLADWLDDEVPIEWLSDLLALIHSTPNLDWLLLTKRPQNFSPRILAVIYHLSGIDPKMHDPLFFNWLTAWHCPDGCDEGEPDRPPENVWMGTTCEDQARADQRIPELLKIPAKVRFLSCEPLLGFVDICHWIKVCKHWKGGMTPPPFPHCSYEPQSLVGAGWKNPINWVICGGESGSDARPMDAFYAASLRDQCAAGGIPFLFKQWGEYIPQYQQMPDGVTYCGPMDFIRPGKKAAGRLLDGIEHNAFPKHEK